MNNNKQKRQNIYRVIMLVVLTAVITFMVTTIAMYSKFQNSGSLSSNGSSSSSENTLVKTLQSFKAMINKLYIGDVDEDAMIEGALKGYVEGLGDPYTEYYTKEEMADLREELNSEYVGIGVYIGNNAVDNTIVIAGTIKSSPAEEAGLKAGDVVEKIDDVSYTGKQLSEATKVLKAEEGTTVKLTILRDEKEIEINITRRKITVEHVSSKMMDNNVAYIKIDSFDNNVADSFKSQLTDLMKGNVNGIIIDLRSNGGGIVTEATDIADLFLEKDETILITKSKKDNEEKITKSKQEPIVKNTPVVILVNEATASASEILAGALKDKYNATIVGKTTYGKGVIQSLYNLKDGSGLKITTDEYFTPNHNKIQKTGITPDVEVDLTKDADGNYETGDKDAQLLKAIEVIKGKMLEVTIQ